jgi:hypothetical protein
VDFQGTTGGVVIHADGFIINGCNGSALRF